MKQRRQRNVAAVFGLSAAAHAALYALAAGSGDDRVASLAAAGSFAVAAFAALRSLEIHPLAPAMLYLWTLSAFHLGLVTPWALDMSSGNTPLWLLTHRLDASLALLVVAFACYQTGLTFAAWRWPALAATRAPMMHNGGMYRFGLAVAALGVGLLVAGAWMIGFDRLAQATYFESYQLTQRYDPRLFISSLQVSPMGFYLAMAAAPVRRMRWVAFLGLLWCVAVFALGYRGFALTPAATMLAVMHKRGFHLPRSLGLAALVVVLFAIPAARALRDNPLGERSLGDIAIETHPLAGIEEVGGSLRPLVHTLELMQNEPLRWGYTYWQAFEMILPNLALRWQADTYAPVEKLPASLWMARLATPWHYYHGGGLGFSAVAEPYMNFGVPGVIGYFALLAVALVWCDRLSGVRPWRVAVWAMALGPLLWTARNAYTVFVRPAVWGALLVLAAYALSRAASDLRRERRTARPVPSLNRGVPSL
ncbi:MAG: O-antigen polysaccharide polymerase Wzy [Bryobacterales bacterium]|nr:O-antigen polysaccharide polymerase Wzy [Bryobacterales bacterium]